MPTRVTRRETRQQGDPMRSVATVLAIVVAAVSLLACSTGADTPDGYQRIEHPEATIVVPDEWETGDPGDMAEIDPDIIDVRLPGAPDGLPIGVRLWHYGRSEQQLFLSAEEPAGLQSALLPASRDQLRREEVEVPGAEDGFLLQLEADSSALDEPVRATYVVGRRSDQQAIMLSILGTAEQIPDEVIDTIAGSLQLTDAVDDTTDPTESP